MPDTKAVEFQSFTANMLVTDLAAAKQFYANKLGFEVVMDEIENNFVSFTRGNVSIAILGSKDRAGTSWCSLIVSDPATLFEQYKQAGVPIFRALETWGDHTEFSIKDLDGNRIDIGNPMY